MKKLLFAALFILIAGRAPAQTDLSADLIPRESLTASGFTAQQYPDADIVLIEDQTRVRYEADGSCRYISDTAFKILTEKGRQDKSVITLGYSADYGTTRFLCAEVIKPDGKVAAVDLKAQSSEAINQGQMSANIYDPSQKEIRLTVPDLETGDILRYTVFSEQTKTVVPGTWSDVFTLEETFPIIHAKYEVDAPASKPLVRIELKNEIPGTVTRRTEKSGDRIRYSWEARNVPQMFEEPQMPERYTVVQRLLVSTIPDWETLSKWYWELSKPRLDTASPAMKSKVRELTGGITNRQEQIEAIFRFVSQDIRYMGITVEDDAPGYEPHDVSLTFNNRYGVCRDKAALLASLLCLAGFDARPVLIYVGPRKDPEVPQPWFNHAITAVRNEDGTWMLMDATNENTRDILPAYLSNRSYLIATPDGATLKTSPVVPPEKNLLSIEVNATLDSKYRISGEASMSFSGINDTSYRGRLAGLKPEERQPYFEDRLKQAFGNARLLRLRITPEDVRNTAVPLSVEMRFVIENALAAGTAESVLQVPTLINHFGLFGKLIGEGIGLDRRRYPLNTGFTCGVQENVRLNLAGSGLRPAALPDYETIDTPELRISRAVTASNSLLISRAEIMLRTVEFSPEQYLTLKKNLKTSERNARQRVILERAGFPAEADLATLSETVNYTLYDANNWKEDRVVQQKVLTYAGKKQRSDLRFPFNPAFQQVALISATVTGPDGKVKYIDPEKEINVMDADWVAGAPRYPAEKIMVASLPGVEVGSTIEYHVASLHRGVPFFSAAEYFADHNPLVKKTVHVEVPYNLKLNIIETSDLRRRTSHRNGTLTHEWTIENRGMIRKEENLPPDWTIKPSVMLSCGNTGNYAALVEKTLLKAAKENKAVAAQTRTLTKDCKTRTEKIKVLRDFADRSVRNAGPGLAAMPLDAITPADRILAEGYGNSTDRAVLLYAMLDAAGLKPRFVLSSGLPRLSKASAPVLNTLQRVSFDTVLTAVTGDKKETIYLGDSSQYAEPGTTAHNQRPSIDLRNGKPETVRSRFNNAAETRFTLTVSETGDVNVVKTAVFSGTEFEKFNKLFSQFTPEDRRREHQNLLSRISQSAQADGELKTSFTHPGQLEFAARLPTYASRNGDRLYFILPEGLGDILKLKSSLRENPFYIDDPVQTTFLYEIALPDGWEPVLAPSPFRLELPDGAGFAEVNVSANGNRLVILQTARLNSAIIPADEYDKLAELNDALTAPATRTVLLRKK